MNFLMRPAQPVVPDLPTIPEVRKETQSVPQPSTTLEGLIAEDPFSKSSSEDGEGENDGDAVNTVASGLSAKNQVLIGNHSDVTEDEGWITIPCNKLHENWNEAPDIQSLHSLDRSFVFPGEQLHILACLSASKQETEIITPFRVAAVMSKNGNHVINANDQTETIGTKSSFTSGNVEINGEHVDPSSQIVEGNGAAILTAEKINGNQDISATESLLRLEDHKQRTEILLDKFKNSHFFVRIAESDEPLWSKTHTPELNDGGSKKTLVRENHLNAVIDNGNFDGNASGGVARNTVRCCSLSNGDIVVLLQVNVGTNIVVDPVLEILQFEKNRTTNFASENNDNHILTTHEDPCGELLKWLLPLDRALPPPRPLSPPLGSTSGIGSASHRSTLSASSGSQLFSFGHFRSYSMPSLPQASIPSSIDSKPSFDLQDFHHYSPEKLIKSHNLGNEGLLSFRGVSLEPERFSVHCGLEGIYIPGRRWRKKVEVIQPLEIHSFAAYCNTEDLLCIQIKNVSPAHIPDIIIFLDAITVIFEEAPNIGPPLSLPISCIEAGNGHSLPNLPLRRGEEHSFILKPATSMAREIKGHGDKTSLLSNSQVGAAASSIHKIPVIGVGGKVSLNTDQYAVIVSCRCNYTESKLFFKKPTSWRPRITRDLMISVASETSDHTFEPSARVTRLPVQVLTLQASNLTSEDLTLTVLAPASFTSPPSLVSLNSAPTTPVSSFGFPELSGRAGEERHGGSMQRLNSMPIPDSQKESGGGTRSISLSERTVSTSDVIPTTDLGCTHLWLQSTVPLGCVPAQSSTTVKLELLPLTDGIITLDTLQVAVKDKGLTYIPEHSLKVLATSSIVTGIM